MTREIAPDSTRLAILRAIENFNREHRLPPEPVISAHVSFAVMAALRGRVPNETITYLALTITQASQVGVELEITDYVKPDDSLIGVLDIRDKNSLYAAVAPFDAVDGRLMNITE